MQRFITRWGQTAQEPLEKRNTSRPGARTTRRECYLTDRFVMKKVCPDFRVKEQVLFLGMGSGEGGSSPSPAYLCRTRTRFCVRNSLKGCHPRRPQNGISDHGIEPVM